MWYCWPAIYECGTPLQRQEKKKGSAGASPMAAPMTKSAPGLMREKIDCLEGECVAYLSPMGWPGIYSVCFSQLDGDKDSLVWDFLSLSLSD